MNMEIEYSYHPTSIGSDSCEKVNVQRQNNLKSFALPWYVIAENDYVIKMLIHEER